MVRMHDRAGRSGRVRPVFAKGPVIRNRESNNELPKLTGYGRARVEQVAAAFGGKGFELQGR